MNPKDCLSKIINEKKEHMTGIKEEGNVQKKQQQQKQQLLTCKPYIITPVRV